MGDPRRASGGAVPADIPVLIITGTFGVGKSAVAEEIHELLSSADLSHAVIDLDYLSSCWPRLDPLNRAIAHRNLSSVWSNYRAAGCRSAVIPRTISQRKDLDDIVRAIPGAQLVVCKLDATPETVEARLRARDHGSDLEEILASTLDWRVAVDEARVEDFVVTTDRKSVAVVAQEVLDTAGWLDGQFEDGG